MKPLRLLGGCLLLALPHLALGSGLSCSKKQFEHDGRCCDKCPPGKKLDSECSDKAGTTCGKCEDNSFQPDWTRERHCIQHTPCNTGGLVVKRHGNREQDTVCQCQAGSYCMSPACQTCRKVFPCQPGFGVQFPANDTSNTICKPCPVGTFSNVSSATEPCHNWTSCRARGLVRTADGTQHSDVVCDEAKPSHSLATGLIPVVVVAVTAGLAWLVYWLYRRGSCQGLLDRMQKPVPPPPNIVPMERKQPEERDEEELHTIPKQETLLGHQPVAQEDGKESRLAEQEWV